MSNQGYIIDELEAVEKSLEILELVRTKSESKDIKDMLTKHDSDFPLCSNAYYRKQSCAYAGVCDCCLFSYHYGLFSCRQVLKPRRWLRDWIEIFRDMLAGVIIDVEGYEEMI